ncbi:ABC-F family ATP-binding cassette domain-containing protein [Halobacillus salinarum]|uniref:ABC-F family ATP-binding cassette domain-containing protein n=1 Tax=Halobacillus salinarum TaxID=2932257 RepID=A0ABY4EQI9_9BACI|nr:ABC-F family ATP-binding cassette domain-containing protein [Halobacillus salinarum]UOQ44366.1 ABC-F family ATP-binding cassette domain-containing protein [Halobacillus salinarum]
MLITLKNAYKIVGGNELFQALNFELQAGQKAALVGRNGSGKSTLFRLLTKEESLDGGDLFIQKGLSIGYLHQIPEERNDTGYDYLKSAFHALQQMMEEMKKLETAMLDPEQMEKALKQYGELQDRFTRAGGYEMESMISQVAQGLNIQSLLNQSCRHLSGGEKTKLGLAKILLEKPGLLLLDEPTNHLDLQAIEWLEGYIQQYHGTVCMISHDRSFLDHTVDGIMEIESGEIDRYKGNYSSYEKQKEEKLLAEFHQYQEQQKKIKKMKEAIKRLRQWANEANPPNEKLFKKAKSMERALERMEKIDKPLIDPKKMNLTFHTKDRMGKDIIVAEKLHKSYASRNILADLDLHIRYRDRLAIVGENGCGKSTLLKLLLKVEKPDQGTIRTGPSAKFGYLAQNPLQDNDEHVRMIDYFRSFIRVTEGQARHILAGFMFYGYDVFKKIGQLSGGERMRLKLAIFMHQGINVLVLDEPTNHLDIDSQEVLEDAVQGFEGTVICVSHDRYFLNQCFNETAYLVNGQLHRYFGSYEETNHHWNALLEEQKSVTVKKEAVKAAIKPESPSSRPESLEVQIEEKEQQLALIEEEMERKTSSSDIEKLEKEKRALAQDIDKLYERWMEA